MVAASSFRAVSSKWRLGWNGFASSSAKGISRAAGPCPSAPGISAPRPLPSPRLCTIDHLPRQLQIPLGAGTPDVIQDDRLAVAGGLGQPNVSRDDRAEDPVPEVLPHLPLDLGRQVHTTVVHREQDTLQASVTPFA